MEKVISANNSKIRKKGFATFSLLLIFVLMFSTLVQAKTVSVGTVDGSITWQYNDYVGTKADTGAKVFLISKKCTKKDFKGINGVTLSTGYIDSKLKNKVFFTKTDGYGNFKIRRVPTGKYYIIVISKNTTRNFELSVKGVYSHELMSKFLSSNQLKDFSETASLKLNKSHGQSVTIYKNDTTDVNYDFGNTYI